MALGGALKSVFTRFTFDFDGAKLSAINRTTGRAVTNLSMAARQAAALKQQTVGFLGGLRSFLALAVGGVFIRGITTGFSVGADQVAKFARATGLATETYQGLIHAAELSGITQQEVNKSLMQLSKRARDASMGLKASKLAFEEIGVSVTDASGELKNGDQIMLELADRFREMPDGSKKTALSMELMGRSGAKLNVLLNEGSEGIRRYIADAKKLGIVLSKEDLKAAEKFNDEMLRAKSILIGLRNQIAVHVIPVLSAAAEAFTKFTSTGVGAKVMLTALIAVATVASVVIGAVVTKFLIAQWAVFVKILRNAVLVISQMNFAMLPVVLLAVALAAAIAGLVLVIEDLVFFARGDKSLIGRVFGRDEGLLESIHELEETLQKVITDLTKAWVELWAAAVKLAGAFGIELTTIGALLKTIAKFVFKKFLQGLLAVAWVLTKIVWLFSKILEGVAWVVTALLDELLPVAERIRDAFIGMLEELQPAFDWIEKAGKFAADKIGGFFKAAAKIAKDAWKDVGDFIDRIGKRAVRGFGRVKRFVTGATQPVFTPPAPAPAVGGAFGRPAAGPTTVNVGGVKVETAGLDEAGARRVAREAVQGAVNGAVRDIKPAVVSPAGLPVGTVGI